jgi:uroporphyrinogen decarboxylase
LTTPALHDSRFLKSARCEPADTTPVWIMRQAGRYMPEYMAVRSRVTFLELCKRPELAAEVTLTAQRVLGVDAAILFADLLPILEPMGLRLEYLPDEGPVIRNPLREARDLDRFHLLEDVGALEYVIDAVRLVRRDLPSGIPLLGFAGAPFTLASYAIEGGSSRNYLHTKRLMYSDRGAWHTLMERLVVSLGRYLQAQIAAGCQAVQVFDSWAGCLGPADYCEFVLPYTRDLLQSLPAAVPAIHFLTGNPALLRWQAEAGGQVQGLDWRCDLAEAWQTVGHDRAVQGNLDPVTLFAELPVVRERTRAILAAAGGRPGHIFNLGHGVLPGTPVEHVKALVEMVHELGARC